MFHRILLPVFLFTLLSLTGCQVITRPAVRPLRVLKSEPAAQTPNELIVILPGRYSTPEEVMREGVVEQVRLSRPRARIAVPDLHLGYYMNRSVDVCLYEELIEPARNQHLRVTLIGISMGGLGAVITALRYPESVDEMGLLAPYLGDDRLMDEMQSRGGLRQWSSGIVEPQNKDESMRFLWERMKSQWGEAKSTRPPIRLVVGVSDRHRPMNAYFAETFLTSKAYREVPGGHDWQAWRHGMAWLLK